MSGEGQKAGFASHQARPASPFFVSLLPNTFCASRFLVSFEPHSRNLGER